MGPFMDLIMDLMDFMDLVVNLVDLTVRNSFEFLPRKKNVFLFMQILAAAVEKCFLD